MSNSCIFVMQSCDTANVMASPCQPGSASPCDQRKRRWCPRNANVTANDQYRQKVTMTWYDITAYKSRGIHVMWWLSTTRKATKETSADWSVAKGTVYVAYQPLHVSKNVSRDVLCTRVGWYDFTVGSSRNHESTTTTTATIGYMSKATTMQVHNILPSLRDYDLRYPYATFCETHEHLPTNLPFSFFLPWMRSFLFNSSEICL